MRRIALLIVLCVACNDEPPPAAQALTTEAWPDPIDGDDLVVRWRARDLWGLETLEVRRDGAMVYSIDRAHAPVLRVERTVNGEELTELRDRLLALDCCALESDPVTAFPDPPTEALLELRLPGLECDVHRLLRHWDDEATVRCDDAVRQLHGRIRPRGRPAPDADGADDSAPEAEAEEQTSDQEQPDEAVGEVPPG